MGLPTLEALLSHPLFADETVTTVGIKPLLKVVAVQRVRGLFLSCRLFNLQACRRTVLCKVFVARRSCQMPVLENQARSYGQARLIA